MVGQSDQTLLTTIVRMDELYIRFDVPEVDLVEYLKSRTNGPQLDPKTGEIPVEVGIAKEDGYPHHGKLDFQENKVDTSTGTIRLRGKIENPKGPSGPRPLYPGLYVRVRVPRGKPGPQLTIPEDCIMTGQEGRYVYVVKPDNTVEHRIVTVGPVVWKTPPPTPGVVPPRWMLVNPSPKPGEDGRRRRRGGNRSSRWSPSRPGSPPATA